MAYVPAGMRLRGTMRSARKVEPLEGWSLGLITERRLSHVAEKRNQHAAPRASKRSRPLPVLWRAACARPAYAAVRLGKSVEEVGGRRVLACAWRRR